MTRDPLTDEEKNCVRRWLEKPHKLHYCPFSFISSCPGENDELFHICDTWFEGLEPWKSCPCDIYDIEIVKCIAREMISK